MGASSLKHFILPAMTLALTNMAIDLRMTRSSMLEVMRQDYIHAARAKVCLIKLLFLSMLLKCDDTGHHFNRHQLWLFAAACVITEQVFGMPGLEVYLLTQSEQRIRLCLQAQYFVLALMFSLVSLTVDISYGFLILR